MVNGNLAIALSSNVFQEIEIPESTLKFCAVSLSDVISRGKRLEASVFDVEAMHNYQMIKNGKYASVPLIGNNSPVKRAYYGARLKRNYIESNFPNATGFVGSSEMLDCYPQPVKFMEDTERTKELHVKYGDILISRSGTIGNLAFVGRTLEKLLVSEHAIRLECREYPGFVYAFLKTKTGQSLVRSNIYGSVIQEIEPEHLATIPVPDAPAVIKKRINNLIVDSYELRDESNALIDEATALLVKELQFPDIHDFKVALFKKNASVKTFNVKLSNMMGRADASYHTPIVDAIVKHMKRYAAEVTTLGDERLSKDIILAGVFKRTYVEKDYGYPFLGGKEIRQLAPKTEKYLARAVHKSRYEKELKVEKNTILITDRGTIGTTAFVPEHWTGYAVSQNVLKLIPANNSIAGYLFIYLSSDWGRLLVKRQTYGSVVDMIDNNSLKAVECPLLKNIDVQRRINELALEANDKRYEAYKLEQQALQIVNKDVIFAK